MRKIIILVAMIFFISCSDSNKKLTVKDIEIFKATPAWDLARALETSNFRKAKEILSKDNNDLVDYQDPIFGTTLLMRAALKENYKVAQFLLENGANPNIISKTGTTALFRTVSHSSGDKEVKENTKLLELLLNNGANPNISYCAPKNDSIISPIECGTSPLIHATQRGLNKVKLLIAHGANINYKTDLGTTAAIKALLNENVDSYYTRISGYDYQRIPLNKPFELIKLKGEDIWYINTSILPKEAGSLGPIDSIFCDENAIYGYKSFYQDPEWEQFKTPELWFYINVTKKKIIRYSNQKDFLSSNEEAKQMRSVDYYYSIFKEKSVLPWFEDSIKIAIKNKQ